MKAITKFQALYGSEFSTEDKCRDYESLCSEISEVMAALPHVDISGDGFVQLDGPTVLRVQRRLVEIFERVHGMRDHHTEWARTADRPAGMTLIGRYVDDCGTPPERAAWYRLQRMDNQFREYEQPYYAIQSDKRAAVGKRRNSWIVKSARK